MQKPTPRCPAAHGSRAKKTIYAGGYGGAAATVLALCLSACASNSSPATGSGPTRTCSDSLARAPQTAVLAVSATSAEPAPVVPPDLREALRRSALKGRPTCVVIVSTERYETVDLTPRRSNGQVENGPARAGRVEANLADLDTRVAGVAQTGPGLNPLAVLDDAARGHPNAGPIYLVTSGVATVAPVDLRRLGWDFDPGQEAALLARQDDLPDLHGHTVVLAGLGDVAGRQPAPGIALRDRLEAWWTAICRAAGASSCTIDPSLIAARPPASHDTVPIVPLPAATVADGQVDLPDALLFAINSAAINPEADPSLSAVVAQAARSGESVEITGHTDVVTGDPAGNRRLSLARAQAVASRLTQLGLPGKQLERITGVGSAGASAVRERTDPGQVDRDRDVRIHFLSPTGH